MSGLNLNAQLTEEEESLLRKQIERLEQAPIYLCNEELNADLLGSTADKFAKANGIKGATDKPCGVRTVANPKTCC